MKSVCRTHFFLLYRLERENGTCGYVVQFEVRPKYVLDLIIGWVSCLSSCLCAVKYQALIPYFLQH